MNIAILARKHQRSPRILAESLKQQLRNEQVNARIFYGLEFLNRYVPFNKSGYRLHFWLLRKIRNYIRDKKLLNELRKFDAVIISECSPNSFSKRLYNIEKFKKKVSKPVLLYEVYYLGNAPTQKQTLKLQKDALEDRYDFHLSVSPVTEIRQPISDNYYPVGIYAKDWNLKPSVNEEIIAILDFEQPGYEEHRNMQRSVLEKLGIKYISLEESYSIEEIRKIYRKGSIYFMQSSEAFGLPILECLCYGCQIFTPFSSWPMSWRLDKEPTVHAEGILPDCFTVYDNNEPRLTEELEHFKNNYKPGSSAKRVFQTLLKYYPSFYYGDEKELSRLINQLNTSTAS